MNRRNTSGVRFVPSSGPFHYPHLSPLGLVELTGSHDTLLTDNRTGEL